MYVYGDHQVTIAAKTARARIRNALAGLGKSAAPDHDIATDLLIEFGEYESAVTDQLRPEYDEFDEWVATMRRAALATGLIFDASWDGRGRDVARHTARFRKQWEKVERIETGVDLRVRVPEGFAFYSLYPEMYLCAAQRFFEKHRPDRVVCIGLRSIGTSLSSVVAARLKRLGCTVELYSLRPHGHPFFRQPCIGAHLGKMMTAHSDAWYLIIDEGPGLSGSTFCGTAHALFELGIADHRIVLFPSWVPDGNAFLNPSSRMRWRRHEKCVAGFDEVWISSGKLCSSFPPHARMQDISGGNWRGLIYDSIHDYPAAHPYLERRKYLLMPGKDSPEKHLRGERADSCRIARFAGLGRHGRQRLERAHTLFRAGFSPRPLDLINGFLILKFVPGRPMRHSDLCPEFLSTASRYLDFLRAGFPADAGCSVATLWDMVIENLTEACDREARKSLERMRGHVPGALEQPAVAVDGRMMPHEWIYDGTVFHKVDNIDHHADQFLPGCQNIAWDAAGLIVEFGLTDSARAALLSSYRRRGGDTDIESRLPFYLLAYLGWRLGYTGLAARTLGVNTPEGRRFERLRAGYSLAAQRHIHVLKNRSGHRRRSVAVV